MLLLRTLCKDNCSRRQIFCALYIHLVANAISHCTSINVLPTPSLDSQPKSCKATPQHDNDIHTGSVPLLCCVEPGFRPEEVGQGQPLEIKITS